MKKIAAAQRPNELCLFAAKVSFTRAQVFLLGMIHVPCSFDRSLPSIRRSGKATLQIIDLTDHAFTKEHQESLRVLLCPSTAQQGAAVEALDATLPTPAQLLVAYDVVHTPFSAQGEEYSRRCTLASRSDGTNYPPSRSSPKAFRQIVAAMAATCWEDDHRMWDGKGKQKLLSASWAEDMSRLLVREGFQCCWEYSDMFLPGLLPELLHCQGQVCRQTVERAHPFAGHCPSI